MASPTTFVIPACSSLPVPLKVTVISAKDRFVKFPSGALSKSSNTSGRRADAAASNDAAAASALGRGSLGPAPSSIAENPVITADGRSCLGSPAGGGVSQAATAKAAQSGRRKKRLMISASTRPEHPLSLASRHGSNALATFGAATSECGRFLITTPTVEVWRRHSGDEPTLRRAASGDEPTLKRAARGRRIHWFYRACKGASSSPES